MFAVNPNNTPELCKGTTRRDKNQSWLEKPRGRKFVDKQKMKVLRTLKKMESMGLDIDSNLVQIKREDLEKIAKKGRENRKRLAEKRKLEKQNKDDNLPETPSKDVSPETSNNSPEKIELVTGKKLTKKTKKAQVKKNVNTTDKEESVKEKKAKSVKKNQNSRVSPSKRKVKQTTDQVDESIASKKRNVKVDESTTANKRAKTAKKSPIKKSKKIPAQIEVDETTTINKRAKTAKKSPIKKSKKTPDQIEVDESTTTTKNIKTSPMKKPSKKNRKLTMNIEEVDEEIIIKTPPNVVKRVKAGKQTVICDATASTVIKTVKRSVTKPLESVSQNLFVGGKKSSPGQFVKLNQGRKRSLKEDTEGVQNSEKKNAGVQNNKKQNAGVQNIKKQKTGVENSKKQTPNKPQRVLRAKSVKSPKTI